jgi:hypothetical protein
VASEFDVPVVDAILLLADSAQVADGKLFVLGGGLAAIGPQPQPVALALLIQVPWDRANLPHDWSVELLDEDGVPVLHDDVPVMVSGQFEAGRPAGLLPGTPLPVPIAINFSALPVTPGRRFLWRLAVDGTSEAAWQVGFSVRAAAVEQA